MPTFGKYSMIERDKKTINKLACDCGPHIYFVVRQNEFIYYLSQEQTFHTTIYANGVAHYSIGHSVQVCRIALLPLLLAEL